MEGEGVQPPPVVVVEEEVVVPPPPLVEEEEVVHEPPPLVEEEEVVVPPPPLVEEEVVVPPPPLVEEEEVVHEPPPLVEEEEVVVPPPPLVEEEEVVVQPPPLLVEEEVIVQPPPLVEEEVVVVQPPPLVEEEEVLHEPPPLVEEEEVVVQPPPLLVEEEVVVQPPPLVEEKEVVVQPPPLVEEEEVVQELPDPDPHALLLGQWVAARLAYATHYRHLVATGMDDVITDCETARGTLHEVAAVLLDEPVDAAETIYTDLLEAVSRGMDSLLIGPAAKIVNSLFNWPGPLAGAIDVARVLVPDTDYLRPLQGARDKLGYLVDVVHADAGTHFSLYAWILGLDLDALPGGQGAFELWVANHNQADAQARVVLQRLNLAIEWSLAAGCTVHLCGVMPASRVRPGGGPHGPLAAQWLPEIIRTVDNVLVALREMRDTLVGVEQDVLNVIFGGQGPPPP